MSLESARTHFHDHMKELEKHKAEPGAKLVLDALEKIDIEKITDIDAIQQLSEVIQRTLKLINPTTSVVNRHQNPQKNLDAYQDVVQEIQNVIFRVRIVNNLLDSQQQSFDAQKIGFVSIGKPLVDKIHQNWPIKTLKEQTNGFAEHRGKNDTYIKNAQGVMQYYPSSQDNGKKVELSNEAYKAKPVVGMMQGVKDELIVQTQNGIIPDSYLQKANISANFTRIFDGNTLYVIERDINFEFNKMEGEGRDVAHTKKMRLGYDVVHVYKKNIEDEWAIQDIWVPAERLDDAEDLINNPIHTLISTPEKIVFGEFENITDFQQFGFSFVQNVNEAPDSDPAVNRLREDYNQFGGRGLTIWIDEECYNKDTQKLPTSCLYESGLTHCKQSHFSPFELIAKHKLTLEATKNAPSASSEIPNLSVVRTLVFKQSKSGNSYFITIENNIKLDNKQIPGEYITFYLITDTGLVKQGQCTSIANTEFEELTGYKKDDTAKTIATATNVKDMHAFVRNLGFSPLPVRDNQHLANEGIKDFVESSIDRDHKGRRGGTWIGNVHYLKEQTLPSQGIEAYNRGRKNNTQEQSAPLRSRFNKTTNRMNGKVEWNLKAEEHVVFTNGGAENQSRHYQIVIDNNLEKSVMSMGTATTPSVETCSAIAPPGAETVTIFELNQDGTVKQETMYATTPAKPYINNLLEDPLWCELKNAVLDPSFQKNDIAALNKLYESITDFLKTNKLKDLNDYRQNIAKISQQHAAIIQEVEAIAFEHAQALLRAKTLEIQAGSIKAAVFNLLLSALTNAKNSNEIDTGLYIEILVRSIELMDCKDISNNKNLITNYLQLAEEVKGKVGFSNNKLAYTMTFLCALITVCCIAAVVLLSAEIEIPILVGAMAYYLAGAFLGVIGTFVSRSYIPRYSPLYDAMLNVKESVDPSQSLWKNWSFSP